MQPRIKLLMRNVQVYCKIYNTARKTLQQEVP